MSAYGRKPFACKLGAYIKSLFDGALIQEIGVLLSHSEELELAAAGVLESLVDTGGVREDGHGYGGAGQEPVGKLRGGDGVSSRS